MLKYKGQAKSPLVFHCCLWEVGEQNHSRRRKEETVDMTRKYNF